ncbi:MAG: hypothetical protein HYS59_01715 [Candidatus Vogelbacteria bacterium]|nr:hypothetical protein [Candidatus Vogelbacteria bacterium]
MDIQILEKPISIDSAREFGAHWYPDFLKGSVDISENKIALGGDYHIESAELLVKRGSRHENVWGFNIRFDEKASKIEFDSMINIKPQFNNRSRIITNDEIARKVENIVRSWILF